MSDAVEDESDEGSEQEADDPRCPHCGVKQLWGLRAPVFDEDAGVDNGCMIFIDEPMDCRACGRTFLVVNDDDREIELLKL